MAIYKKDLRLSEKGYGLTFNNPHDIDVPVEQARFEVLVDEIRELKRRVSKLESKLQGDSSIAIDYKALVYRSHKVVIKT